MELRFSVDYSRFHPRKCPIYRLFARGRAEKARKSAAFAQGRRARPERHPASSWETKPRPGHAGAGLLPPFETGYEPAFTSSRILLYLVRISSVSGWKKMPLFSSASGVLRFNSASFSGPTISNAFLLAWP